MRYDGIDEGHLNRTERLGLAYCRLNSFEWDPILGEKPDGFDNLPNYTEKRRLPLFKRKPSKCDFVAPAIMAIKSIIERPIPAVTGGGSSYTNPMRNGFTGM